MEIFLRVTQTYYARQIKFVTQPVSVLTNNNKYMYIEPLPQTGCGGGGGRMFYIGMFCYSDIVLKKFILLLCTPMFTNPVPPKGRGGCILVGQNTICYKKN